MGDGLSIGKTWTVTVPSDSARTINSNLWQYSVFPYTTPPSVMYPCDSLSSMNDTQLMNFDYSVGSFMDMSTSLYANIMPMMKQWMAQQAEMYKKIMENLHSNTRITNPNPSDDDDDTSKIDGKKHVKEAKVVETLQRMANNPDIKSRFNTEITYTNKEGKDVKAKLIDRLTALCEEYRKSPDTAELSEDNFNTIWDIAGKFVKTGELTTADYKALLEIAKNPEGPGAYKKSDDDDDDDDGKKKGVRPQKNQDVLTAAEAGSDNNYEQLAERFQNALYRPGTNRKELYTLTSEKLMNEYNVLEVYNEFGQLDEARQYNESLVEAIFDDCDGWYDCAEYWGSRKNNAKPHIVAIDKAFIARAQRFAKNNPEVAAKYGYLKEVTNPTAEQKKKLIEAGGKYYDPEQLNIESTLIDKKDRDITVENFEKFAEKLTKAEKEAYGEE